jgi:hypothetical protein
MMVRGHVGWDCRVKDTENTESGIGSEAKEADRVDD